jgi:hypothetical protein
LEGHRGASRKLESQDADAGILSVGKPLGEGRIPFAERAEGPRVFTHDRENDPAIGAPAGQVY